MNTQDVIMNWMVVNATDSMQHGFSIKAELTQAVNPNVDLAEAARTYEKAMQTLHGVNVRVKVVEIPHLVVIEL